GYAGFSDITRSVIHYHWGGVYLDADNQVDERRILEETQQVLNSKYGYGIDIGPYGKNSTPAMRNTYLIGPAGHEFDPDLISGIAAKYALPQNAVIPDLLDGIEEDAGHRRNSVVNRASLHLGYGRLMFEAYEDGQMPNVATIRVGSDASWHPIGPVRPVRG